MTGDPCPESQPALSGPAFILQALMALSTENIPQEIVDEIIQRAEKDPSTLCNLCLVSTSFLPQARRVLYQDINICSDDHDAPVYSGWVVNVERAIKFLETITTHNSALATHVQRLYHHCDNSDLHYWDLMKRSLRLTVNLRSLILTDIPLSTSDLFGGCTFRLRVFECDATCDDSKTRHEITQFLSQQADLKSLDICGYTGPDESFLRPHLPKLEALIGDSCTIENLLPRQPLVTKLTWILHLPDGISEPPAPHAIASSLSKIHVFSLGGYFWRPDISLFLPYLSSVQVLRLIGEASNLPLHDEFALIPGLPKLRIFIWSAGFPPVDWSFFENRMDRHSQSEFVKKLFERSTVLERVYIHTLPSITGMSVPPRPKFDFPCYLCWERSKTEPNIVGFQGAVVDHGVVSWYC